MKLLLYIIYALQFYIYRLMVKVDDRYYVFVMTHDTSYYGNIQCMYRTILKKEPQSSFYFITKEGQGKTKFDKVKSYIHLLFVTPRNLAKAKYIYLDNVFLPMAFIRFSKKTKIVQLWHGMSTIKKFGQLSNTGMLKILERMANRTYTHVTVSSEKVIELHVKAFGIKPNRVYPVGVPRADVLQNNSLIRGLREKLFSQYPQLNDKRIILYAPTFRDGQLSSVDKEMQLKDIQEMLDKESIILTKWHPHMKLNDEESASFENQITSQLSIYELMCIADILITDYSSIVFEFALMYKPVLIYAYDLKKYANTIRGFYGDYRQLVGTKIAQNKQQLINNINHISEKDIYSKEFVSNYIDWRDTESTERIYTLVKE